jgi:uncharacterized protein with von Willebrand factor type A (vWA) domain
MTAGALAANVAHFARVLRTAGLAVGPDRVLASLQALEAIGLDRREDVHAALAAVMLDRHEQQPLFDAAFAAFWRDPKLAERMMALLLPTVDARTGTKDERRSQRLAEALAAPRAAAEPPAPRPGGEDEELALEAAFTASERERLARADFESMTAEEFALARRLVEEIPLPVPPVVRRRRRASVRGRIDLQATLRAMARAPDTLLPARRAPRVEPPPVVLLVDVSRSMERYARIVLHWAHALTRRDPRTATFVFGTRLTNVTRALRGRDPDLAMERVDLAVPDWKGGTRIAASLDAFNRTWARRVLGQRAALLLVTDGLDHDEQGELTRAARQLRLLADRILWLNPLLRYDAFRPLAGGVRALLPHVDELLPVHDLRSLGDLAATLRDRRGAGQRMRRWR